MRALPSPVFSALSCFALALCTGCAAPPLHVPPGWQARLDDPAVPRASVRLLDTKTGLLADNKSNVTFWREEDTAQPPYEVSVDVHHLDSHGHAHGAGLIFGGRDLDGPGQVYSYFLVRADGAFLIKRRDGETTTDIRPWTEHSAVRREDRSGLAQNLLTVEVGAQETRFSVNGILVHRARNADLHTAGRYGLRVVHDLRILFTALQCQPVAGS